mgnify:CR=1 FL=1
MENYSDKKVNTLSDKAKGILAASLAFVVLLGLGALLLSKLLMILAFVAILPVYRIFAPILKRTEIEKSVKRAFEKSFPDAVTLDQKVDTIYIGNPDKYWDEYTLHVKTNFGSEELEELMRNRLGKYFQDGMKFHFVFSPEAPSDDFNLKLEISFE